MRNRFSEMIEKGVASFEYTPVLKETPEVGPICRTYNNIFAGPTDTHMSRTEDGYVITGSAVATDKWEPKIMNTWGLGAIDFRPSGYWCISDFLYRNRLRGSKAQLNGDIVYKILPVVEPSASYSMPSAATTNESKIPVSLISCGALQALAECFADKESADQIAQAMNKHRGVQGDNWIVDQNGRICGLIGNTVYHI